MSAQATTSVVSSGAHGRAALLTTATFSQLGASVMQQGTVVLGVFFAAAYQLNLTQMGALLAAMSLGQTLSGFGVGQLVDIWGPRKVLFFCTLNMCAATATIALNPGLIATGALLFVTGLALGAVPLSGTKAVLVMWPRERRGMPMGIRQMGVPLGALLASLALPTLASHVGVAPIYGGFTALLAVSGLLFCAVLAPQPIRPTRLQARLARGEANRMLTPAICGFLLVWGQYTLLTFTIPMLRTYGLSLFLAGGLLALAQVGAAVARLALGAISDRMGGRRENELLGITLVSVALCVTLTALPPHLPLLALATLWLALGASFVGWNALALTWAGERVSQAHAGTAIGLETSAVLCGATVTAPVIGAIVQLTGTYRAAWLTLAVVLGAAAVLLWMEKRRPEPAHAEPQLTDVSMKSQTI